MKKIIVFGLILMAAHAVSGFAPVDSIGSKWVEGKRYIEHQVEAHEGWFAIARKYGIPYSDIRIANKDSGDSLKIGQVVLVPLYKGKANDPRNLKNYTQTDASKKEKGAAIYHTVKKKETLYSISKKYEITTDSLMKLNHLSSENLQKGDKLIVGYKKTKEEKKAAKNKSTQANEPVVNKEIEPVIAQPEKTEVVIAKPEVKDTIVKIDTAGRQPVMPKYRREVSEQGVATWIEDENINPNKYFALHRTASIGGIIKITNRMNKRSVFVKVVGKLPDTGDNENIIIKVSRASAEKLGVRDQRFQCDLRYGVTEK